MPEPAKNSPTT